MTSSRLPVSVLVPLSQSRATFFGERSYPSILANRPSELIVEAGPGSCASKRNRAAREAASPFLFFCDDDVVLNPNALANLYRALTEIDSGAGYAYGDHRLLDNQGRIHGLHVARPFDPEVLREQNYVSTMTLIRREVFPGFDETLERFLDWDVWLTLWRRRIHGLYVPGVLFDAYYCDEGISATVPESAALERIRTKHRGLAGWEKAAC